MVAVFTGEAFFCTLPDLQKSKYFLNIMQDNINTDTIFLTNMSGVQFGCLGILSTNVRWKPIFKCVLPYIYIYIYIFG